MNIKMELHSDRKPWTRRGSLFRMNGSYEALHSYRWVAELDGVRYSHDFILSAKGNWKHMARMARDFRLRLWEQVVRIQIPDRVKGHLR